MSPGGPGTAGWYDNPLNPDEKYDTPGHPELARHIVKCQCS